MKWNPKLSITKWGSYTHSENTSQNHTNLGILSKHASLKAYANPTQVIQTTKKTHSCTNPRHISHACRRKDASCTCTNPCKENLWWSYSNGEITETTKRMHFHCWSPQPHGFNMDIRELYVPHFKHVRNKAYFHVRSQYDHLPQGLFIHGALRTKHITNVSP